MDCKAMQKLHFCLARPNSQRPTVGGKAIPFTPSTFHPSPQGLIPAPLNFISCTTSFMAHGRQRRCRTGPAGRFEKLCSFH